MNVNITNEIVYSTNGNYTIEILFIQYKYKLYNANRK